MSSPSETSRARWFSGRLAIAVGVYVALRALILFTAFDRVALPHYELFPMGTIPLVLGVGGGLPVVRMYDNAAGQLLDGLLAAPLYELLGPSWLALKLVPAALGLAALVFLWAWVRELFGERTAFVAALLFAVGPTTMTAYSLTASGNHFEHLAFVSLALWSFFRMHKRGVTPRRLVATACAGGFALFVFLGSITTLALLACAHVGLRGWRAALRDAKWLAAGFALGIAPLLVINGLTGARGLQFLAWTFLGGEASPQPTHVASRLLEFFAADLPRASRFPDAFGVPGRVADYAFCAVFVVALVAALPSASRAVRELARGALHDGACNANGAASAMLALFLPVTAVAFAFSNLLVRSDRTPFVWEGYRYFTPHFFMACALIAAASARGAWLKLVPASALILGTTNFALVDWTFARPNVGAYYEGYNLRAIANQLLSPRNGYSLERLPGVVDAYPPNYRPWIYFGIGRGLAMRAFLRGGAGAVDQRAVLASVPGAPLDEIARGYGSFVRNLARLQGHVDASLLAQLEHSRAAGEPHAAAAVEGLATDWEFKVESGTARDLAELDALFAALPTALHADFARGYGAVCGRLLHRGIPSDAAAVAAACEHVRADLRAVFYDGLGAGLVESPHTLRAPTDLHATLPSNADFAAIERGRETRLREINR